MCHLDIFISRTVLQWQPFLELSIQYKQEGLIFFLNNKQINKQTNKQTKKT